MLFTFLQIHGRIYVVPRPSGFVHQQIDFASHYLDQDSVKLLRICFFSSIDEAFVGEAFMLKLLWVKLLR